MWQPVTEITMDPTAHIPVLDKNPITTVQKLYIAYCLSMHNHPEDDKKTAGMNLKIKAIKLYTAMPECMMTEEISHATHGGDNLGTVTSYVIMAN